MGKKFKQQELGEVFTPKWFVCECLDTLDKQYLEGNVLDPACGNGNWLVEVFRRRLRSGQTSEKAASTIYGVDIRRSNIKKLKKRFIKYGGKGIQGILNKNFIQHDSLYWDFSNWKPAKTKFSVTQAPVRSLFGSKIRWNVIVGNPPYQLPKDQESKNNLLHTYSSYPLFIDLVLSLHPEWFGFVVPAKWFTQEKPLSTIRYKLIHDRHLVTLNTYKSSSIFPQIDHDSEVVWFVRNNKINNYTTYNGKKVDLLSLPTIPPHPDLYQLIKTIHDKRLTTLNPKINFFDIPTNVQAVKEGTKCLVAGNKVILVAGKFHPLKYKYCVVIGKAHKHSLAIYTKNKQLKNIYIVEPGTVWSKSYLLLKSFHTKQEAVNFQQYALTRFFQLLLTGARNSKNINGYCFRYIPDLQDYTKLYTDKKLEKMFSVTIPIYKGKDK